MERIDGMRSLEVMFFIPERLNRMGAASKADRMCDSLVVVVRDGFVGQRSFQKL
jgi:hypothetical protein